MIRASASSACLFSLLLANVLICPRPAAAFCRETTCDVREDDDGCSLDEEGCPTEGTPIAWTDACMTFAVNEAGSRKDQREISAAQAAQALEVALGAWLHVDCGNGEYPSLGVLKPSFASCDRVEHNSNGPNANLIIFRDEAWSAGEARSEGRYGRRAREDERDEVCGAEESQCVEPLPPIARARYGLDASGRVLGCDIEINSEKYDLSEPREGRLQILEAVLIHELGHCLGLGHTNRTDSVMTARYSPEVVANGGLSVDDRLAICTLYPPGRLDRGGCPADTAPPGGFSSYCASSSGCQYTSAPSSSRPVAGLSLLLVAAWRGRRRARGSTVGLPGLGGTQ